MCRFIETIRVDCGEVRNMAYHERRMNDTRTHFWPESPALQLTGYLPAIPGSGVHKLRIVYGQNGIEEVTCTPYTLRPVRSLALIQADDIDYACKSTDRSALNQLFARRGAYDDILIVRRHLLTDTSIANIALFDGSHWHTPQHPLLKGTNRAELLDKGILTEKDIRMEELSAYSTVRLFNAMIDWAKRNCPPIACIRYSEKHECGANSFHFPKICLTFASGV